ncbi:MAG TPA: ABC transporter substrate-binding protein [Acidimicrobiales bacterium]|nr:ABC transporter substrate-binding protein [Acidimicrobiales bacterium]
MSETETTGTPGTPGSEPAPAPLAERPWPRVSRVRIAVPVVLIVAALIAAGIVATVNESNNTSTPSATPTTGAGGTSSSSVPITYATAAKEGTTSSYNWGSECDHHTGRLKMPTVYAPPCVPVPTGSNGGATSPGVTATSINLVYYYPQPGGLASTISGATGTPAQQLATVQAYVAMLNKTYELYGRHVNLIPFEASGADSDPVAAHADAVTVAEQDHAFASIGGPGETTAYEDELARLRVLCMVCGDSATYGLIKQNAPYQWANLPTADTSLNETVDYIIAKLNGKDAVWAGDPSLHSRKRSFITVSETSEPPSPGFNELTASLEKKLRDGHVNVASPIDLTYTLNLTTLPTQAATIAEKLKTSGATSVVFAGDPIMPIYLTKACANIGYSPEWIITGIVLTDTSTLARYYDQGEWSHAFGVSSLAVPVPVAAADADHLYRWWYGPNTSPAALSAPAILPGYEDFFSGVMLAGPHLTPQTFAEGLFRAPPAGGGPTTPLSAYGYQGAAPRPSYSSPADYTFLWYDATAKGPDEEGTVGNGLMQYVNGGARYKAGTVPNGSVPMFSTAGAVTTYATPPDRAPSYPAWPGSPAASGH